MTYYVEPDYWVAGYAEGDTTGGLVFGTAVSAETAAALAAGNYKDASLAWRSAALSSGVVAGDLIQTFPGVNLNSNSQTFCGANVTAFAAGLSQAQSDMRGAGRPFWEMTSPASGTWVKIMPQAEGFGP